GAGLIRPEHNRAIPNPDSVSERRDVAVWDAEGRYRQAVALENRGGLPTGSINDDDLERGDTTVSAECRTQHSERAGLLIEQLREERSKRGNIGVPRRACDGQRCLPDEIAPKQCRQV